MKHKTLVCLALAMMLIAACASAQQLPSVNCFSPGLLKVNGLENSAVSIDAALTVENAMYARNLSVLQAMLDGTIPPELHEKYLGIVLNETERLTRMPTSMMPLTTRIMRAWYRKNAV